jgi:hypothetical protein
MIDRYADIIHLSPPNSGKHPKMAILDRAAQFSPFAALTGFDGEIRETARLTGRRIDPDEQERVQLDAKMQILREQCDKNPQVCVTYYVPDRSKKGGTYITAEGRVKKLLLLEGFLVLDSQVKIPLADILTIESPIFP